MTKDKDKQNLRLEQVEQFPVSHRDNLRLARQEQAEYEHVENTQKNNLGLFGKLWGGRTEKPGNISALLLLVLVVFLGFHLFGNKPGEKFDEIFAGITSIMTLILGYLFGSTDKS